MGLVHNRLISVVALVGKEKVEHVAQASSSQSAAMETVIPRKTASEEPSRAVGHASGSHPFISGCLFWCQTRKRSLSVSVPFCRVEICPSLYLTSVHTTVPVLFKEKQEEK
eukprot:gene7600-5361_t